MNTPIGLPTDLALVAALQARPDVPPESVPQLLKLWGDDFAAVAPGLIPDLVRLKLDNPAHAHFLRTPPSAAPEQVRVGGTVANVLGAAALRAAVERTRQDRGGAPGLGGQWAKS